MDHFYNHLAHVLIIGPALILLGMIPEQLPVHTYKIVLFVGLFVLFYHIYRAYIKISANGIQSAWVNYIHILLVAPVLLILVYYAKDAPRYIR